MLLKLQIWRDPLKTQSEEETGRVGVEVADSSAPPPPRAGQ